ncbi:MAG: bifunctional 5,10-methylenetetrahydrofolate dehydrogenase/5,10-methenyltetrahydrofolate cyclohydrolase [Patescibacteria group bacterium]
MSQIIDGRALAEKIKDKVVKEIVEMGKQKQKAVPETHECKCGHGTEEHAHEHEDSEGHEFATFLNAPRPNLAIVLVGNRKDSEIYVALKEREAKKVGIDTSLYRCPEEITEEELLGMIKYLNSDELIDAILVQLPLPENLNEDRIVAAIDPKKDVDGFHPENLKKLLGSCENKAIMPPVFDTVLEMLKSIDYDLEDKQICVIANSDIFGDSLAKILECRKAKAIAVKSDDKDLKEKTSKADILISAVGKPNFITNEMVKTDAVIIDIGITKENGKIYGDVDFHGVEDKVSFITPVPGGVGPMTIACAFRNVLALYKRKHGKQ